MMNRILKKLAFVLSAPLRYAVRQELKRQGDPLNQNIELVLQRKATESTADYVLKNMGNVDSVSSNMELLTRAVKSADLGSGRLICEFGVYSGGTINHIASLTSQPVYGFDSFEGLPERWRDGFHQGYFKVDALPEVRSNVTLVKGWFDKTLPPFVAEHSGPLGLLHVDCDLYSSTKTVFDILGPRIQPGCVIVFDEYFNYPGWEEGEYKAFQEFLQNAKLDYDYIGYNRLNEQVAVKIK